MIAIPYYHSDSTLIRIVSTEGTLKKTGVASCLLTLGKKARYDPKIYSYFDCLSSISS
jgi:hypothetical protein